MADPNLIKIILHKDEVVGFLLGFPDITPAIQRAKGNITPWSIVDLLVSLKRTKWISGNGAGVLPEYQGLGGNALMYSELEKTINTQGYSFEHLEMTQVAETTQQMRKDLINLGGKAYKNHRVYQEKYLDPHYGHEKRGRLTCLFVFKRSFTGISWRLKIRR